MDSKGTKNAKKENDGELIDEEISKLLDEANDPLPKSVESSAAVVTPVPTSPMEEPEDEPQVDNDLRVILDKFHGVTDKILHNFDCDRDEISDAIDRLRNMMVTSNKPPGYVVESYVSALKTKTDANANIIKLLDAFAKIVASTKNTGIVQETTTIVDINEYLDDKDD